MTPGQMVWHRFGVPGGALFFCTGRSSYPDRGVGSAVAKPEPGPVTPLVVDGASIE